jgi:hypothetical protein
MGASRAPQARIVVSFTFSSLLRIDCPIPLQNRRPLVNCLWCGSSRIRLSYFRWTDFKRLLAFQYPVRCRICGERYSVNFSVAYDLRKPMKAPAAVKARPAQVARKDTFVSAPIPFQISAQSVSLGDSESCPDP